MHIVYQNYQKINFDEEGFDLKRTYDVSFSFPESTFVINFQGITSFVFGVENSVPTLFIFFVFEQMKNQKKLNIL